jgi:DNA modification methylase
MAYQLALFDIPRIRSLKDERRGSFVDNMSLPIHRWFRYSAGFSAGWVQSLIQNWKLDSDNLLLDPFAGSGTVMVVAGTTGIPSVGIEAHSFVARIAKIKTRWNISLSTFSTKRKALIERSKLSKAEPINYPPLILDSFSIDNLRFLHRLKLSWQENDDGSPESELLWLAISAILRPTSHAGTAQWQYILPKKTKKSVIDPLIAFLNHTRSMEADLRWITAKTAESKATIFCSDARKCEQIKSASVGAVITSPPYANNYDYADATRFEMTFWGEVDGWGDLHDKVRKSLIVSSSQHASKEQLVLDEILEAEQLTPIRKELEEVTRILEQTRLKHGGKKHYHTMIAAYFRDLAEVWASLRRVCKQGAHLCWVIGDSAPYGVYCPVDKWLGEIALANGFKSFDFQKLRDRNIKWKNRKHRCPFERRTFIRRRLGMATSYSHTFGQIIGGVIEAAIEPSLQDFSTKHGLFLDKKGYRPARKGMKVSWVDLYGNTHDLDYVLERGGTPEIIGEPIAFIETAWRRYTKHSRNKAQEIQGAIQLLALTHKYSCPFPGVILAGVFTEGALAQLRSLGFQVLYFPYSSVLTAFKAVGIDSDFNENTSESAFAKKK